MTTGGRILAIFGVVVVVGVVAMVLIVPHKAAAPEACTAEAKLCPDGSAVGRTGPNCEFAECPTATTTPGWEMFADPKQGLSFQYPAAIGTTYITPVSWPPTIAMLASQDFSCTRGGTEIAQGGITEEKMIEGKAYCVTTESEGAAGSVYTTYTYKTLASGRLATMTFALRFVQCVNYDDPKKTECVQERQSFDPDQLTGSMFDKMTVLGI